ncbi:MAG: bile acid:sodium symporter, partial [Proteobacteria bacterium]|nr:bile acid:sodium symporter [Pseudomonadota bacterium]
VWGSLNPATAPILRAVSLSPLDVFFTIVMILGIPMVLGMVVGRWFPRLVDRIRKPFKIFAVCVFLAVVGGALAANWQNFIKYVGLVALVVAVHNAMALSLGYSSARLAKLPPKDVRAVAIEVGIQNSALGLILVFDFFGGLGGMAIITAWWGVWHIISGLIVASLWSRRPIKEAAA